MYDSVQLKPLMNLPSLAITTWVHLLIRGTEGYRIYLTIYLCMSLGRSS